MNHNQRVEKKLKALLERTYVFWFYNLFDELTPAHIVADSLQDATNKFDGWLPIVQCELPRS